MFWTRGQCTGHVIDPSADIKERAFLSDWDLLYSFLLLFLILNEMKKSFSVQCCRESVYL